MKKTITTTLLTLATTLGFAQVPTVEILPNIGTIDIAPKISIEKEVSQVRHFRYLRMGVSDRELQSIDVLPGLGLGYRIASGAHALDLSSSYNQREVRTDEGKEKTYFFTLPKANYLYYTNPHSNTSAYAGGGLAWGGMRTKDNRQFIGLIPNVAVGLEMNRNAAWSSFIQLDVSQPAVAASQRGDLPNAFAEVTLGAGF